MEDCPDKCITNCNFIWLCLFCSFLVNIAMCLQSHLLTKQIKILNYRIHIFETIPTAAEATPEIT